MRKSFAKEIKASFRSPLIYIVWAVLSLWLTVSGPFGTREALPAAERALYWTGVVALSILIGRLVRVFAEMALDTRPESLRRLAVAPVIAGVLGPVLWAYTHAFPAALPPTMLQFLAYVFLVALGVQLIRWASAHHVLRFGNLGAHDIPVPAEPAQAEGPRLVTRLDPELRGAVLRVSARDHYLDVYTDKGCGELLLRFSDALAELDRAQGGQVHRSHWVAWDAVAAAEREGARLFLRLVDGGRVPVSRSFLDVVAARGFLSGD